MGKAYQSSDEYLRDELYRLDLLLHLQLVEEPADGADHGENRYKGIIISREEIVALLQGEAADSNSEQTTILEELFRTEKLMNERLEASSCEGVYLPLQHIIAVFQLTYFEYMALVACLAPELDRKYERVYAYLQDDLTVRLPTFGLLLKLFLKSDSKKHSARMALEPSRPLARFLIQVLDPSGNGTTPLIARPLKMEERIVDFLLGCNRIDVRLKTSAKLITGTQPTTETVEMILQAKLERYIQERFLTSRTESRATPVLNLHGPEGTGKKSLIQTICRKLRIPLLLADVRQIIAIGLPYHEALRLLIREAILLNAALCIDHFDSIEASGQIDPIRELTMDGMPVLFLLSRNPLAPSGINKDWTILSLELKMPLVRERLVFWESAGRSYPLGAEVDLAALAEKFRFTPGQIGAVLALASELSIWENSGGGQIGMSQLYQACYYFSNRKLTELAQKIIPRHQWDTLVLPPDQLNQLHEFCNQVKHRHTVHEKWGFDRRLSLGKGVNAIFSGPPGCGKTMAAEVIAGELNLELYKIDLSQVVSKYIGETEKNLGRIFEEAETSNAILFFDEADALFGKRSEVKDAHDRYANIETGYLLQKMEEFEGIVVLASNLSQNMDQAFLRRLQFMIEFPFPEKKERLEIWRKIFPAQSPVAELDYEFLAERLKLAGGNIKNIALRAAFYAAADWQTIGMPQIMQAARREYIKLGKTFLKIDFEPYYQLSGAV